MGEGLREVAEVLAGRTKLLGKQPDMVRVADHLFKQKPRLLDVPGTGKTLDIPEDAHVERAFAPAQPVGPRLTGIAIDQAVIEQLIADGLQRGEPARVRRADETHEWHQQAGCIQCRASLALDKRALLGIPKRRMDLLIDCIASLAPLYQRCRQRPLARKADGAIEC